MKHIFKTKQTQTGTYNSTSKQETEETEDVCKITFLTFRYGFHDVQEAHEQTSGLCLVQLVTTRPVAYERLGPSKLKANIQKQIMSKTVLLVDCCNMEMEFTNTLGGVSVQKV